MRSAVLATPALAHDKVRDAQVGGWLTTAVSGSELPVETTVRSPFVPADRATA